MYELLISMGIQAAVLITAMVVLVLNHAREIRHYKAREEQLYAAVISKDPARYAAVLDALRTDPETRGKLMEIENELAINAQKVLDQQDSKGAYPIT